jgi:hypothetical protein
MTCVHTARRQGPTTSHLGGLDPRRLF